MNPKEKAEELINKFKPLCGGYNGGKINKNFAKQCALIAVDEILHCEATEPSDTDWDDCGATAQYYWPQKKVDAGNFWKECKKEIEKL
jgi:hypothetical protein